MSFGGMGIEKIKDKKVETERNKRQKPAIIKKKEGYSAEKSQLD